MKIIYGEAQRRVPSKMSRHIIARVTRLTIAAVCLGTSLAAAAQPAAAVQPATAASARAAATAVTGSSGGTPWI
jgi:hypothetical protein